MKAIINWFKKYLNILNQNQKATIDAEISDFEKVCVDISYENYKKSYEYINKHNNTCPNCKKTTDIVNKISRVHGDGSVGGSFLLGSGSISGSMKIDTDEVRHCNNCGNEWKTNKHNYRNSGDVKADFLNSIHLHDEGTYTYAEDKFKMIQGYYAETIYKILSECSSYSGSYYSSTLSLSLKTLRKYFKSIHDAN